MLISLSKMVLGNKKFKTKKKLKLIISLFLEFQWLLVGRVEGIFMISKISNTDVRLEIEGLPKGFEMRFQTEQEMKSFISYLGIYIRWVRHSS